MGDGGRWPRLVEPSRPAKPWREVAAAGIAAVAAILVGAWRVGAPGSLGGVWGHYDLTTTYAAARTMLTNVWVSPNHDLAYPFGQDLAGFPAPDLLNLAGLKALVLVVRDPLVASNLFLLLSFGLIAVAAFGLFRLAGVARLLAAALAFSVSLVPWHFDRFTHAFLANYSTVAVGLVLVVAVLSWNLALGGPERARGRTLLLTLAVAGYVGLTGTYYAIFTSILALTALAFQVLLGRRGRSLIGAVWFALLPSVITFAAAFLYRFTAIGYESVQFGRVPYESQLYAGDLFTLLRTTDLWSSALPIPMLEAVPTVASRLEADARNSTIGVLAVVAAFLVSGLVLAANGTGRRPRVVAALGYWPWLFLVALLFFVVGGFGQTFAVFFGNQIRSWGRLAVVLLLIAFLILGLLLTAWWRRSRRPRAVLIGSAVVVVAVTVADVVSLGAPFDRAVAAAEADELREYGVALDAGLPPGCGVLTVPAYQYPEGAPTDGTVVYDPLLPYLFAETPRWSYGGVRGSREGEWQFTSVSRHLPTALAQAVAAGFCAVQVDTHAFDVADSPVQALTATLGPPVAASSTGRWLTFSLDRTDVGDWTRDYALDPARVSFGFGFGPSVVDSAQQSATLVGTDAALVVVAPRAAGTVGTLQAEVRTEERGDGCPVGSSVTFSTPADTVQADVGPGSTVAVPVRVDAGGLAAVHVHAPAGCAVTVVNPRVVPAAS